MSVDGPASSSRRAFLAAAALLPLAGCGTGNDRDSGRAGSTATTGPPSPAPPVRRARLADLEREYGARVGVYALATGTGATVLHRADERFAFCSTFKALAAAAVLHHSSLRGLDRRVTYTRADLKSTAPITGKHVATGMTLRQLCDAAVRYSDGTAGNLLMRDLGGPAKLTAYLRELGDKASRMDHYEPELHDVRPDDPSDTTTPGRSPPTSASCSWAPPCPPANAPCSRTGSRATPPPSAPGASGPDSPRAGRWPTRPVRATTAGPTTSPSSARPAPNRSSWPS